MKVLSDYFTSTIQDNNNKMCDIVICSAMDLLKYKNGLTEALYIDTYKSQVNDVNIRFTDLYAKNTHMYHYFIELVGKEYVISKGIAEYKIAPFLEKAYGKGVAKNKILIVLNSDYDIDIPEKSLYYRFFDLFNHVHISTNNNRHKPKIIKMHTLDNNKIPFSKLSNFDIETKAFRHIL